VIERRRINLWAALAIAAVLAIHAPAAEAGPIAACCVCACGELSFPCIGLSSNCDTACAERGCDFEGASSCPGTVAGCDGDCQAICATETPTVTPTTTPTATPVPVGGSCTDTAQCAPPLICQNNICATTAPVRAISPMGLLFIVGALAALGVLALPRDRRL